MNDCIYRQALLAVIKDLPTCYGDEGCLPFGYGQPPMDALLLPEDVVSAIENLPSADVEPVRHGRWKVNRMYDYKYMTCQSCRWLFEYYAGFEEEWNYCPYCGARMDGEQDG